MTSQIFKNPIPSQLLINLLDEIAIKTEKYYILNNDAYKKGVFNDIIQQFIAKCSPYYHLSKRKYLDKKTTYKSILTIIRQICKFNKIMYTSQIKYDKSTYDIIYNIYL